ncbi:MULTISPECIES: potassium channel family protein [unclassified Streptomyces]|uniref:potassium channel family protein n=1 Tax=unclassified Streptomyces TaxID=2593676 RepID=UPI001F04E9F4|nr:MULTISPECIES: potassium channel family protein [unclassified Streptomyces]MCH0564226.1 two pore domain potassium channel family protein [Streptomyces sp. MUM 2J]MCH0568528.1 two pore domain potassium channel family protein [Streptomyces sp. MUM 136J]
MTDPASRAEGTGEEGSRPDTADRSGRLAAAVALTRPGLFTVGLVTAYYLLPLDGGLTGGSIAGLVCGLLAVTTVFVWEVRTIVRSSHPRLQAVEALAVTVALYLILFASAYHLLDRSAPDTFSEPLTRTDALYYTLTTFATVGFGDITARSQTGRVLTMLQMTGGLILAGVAARILTHAVQTGLRRQGRQPPEPGDGRDAEARP